MLKKLFSLLLTVFLVSAAVRAEDSIKKNPREFTEDHTNFYLSEKKGSRMRLALETKETLAPHLRDFVEKYERVKHFKDEDLLASLVHPASKACEDDTNTDYFDELRYMYLTEILPEGYRLEIYPVNKEKQWPLRNRLGLPLPPTHVMYIEFKVGQDADGSTEIEGWQRFLREETYPEPRIYELVRCPTEQDLKDFRSGKTVEEAIPEPPAQSQPGK